MQLLIIVLNLLSFYLIGGDTECGNKLTNTKWKCEIANACVDIYEFKLKCKVAHYSCEIDNTSEGSYKLHGDTLVINETNGPQDGKVEKWRFKFIIKKDLMYPISSEELINNEWQKQNVTANEHYIFKKVIK